MDHKFINTNFPNPVNTLHRYLLPFFLLYSYFWPSCSLNFQTWYSPTNFFNIRSEYQIDWCSTGESQLIKMEMKKTTSKYKIQMPTNIFNCTNQRICLCMYAVLPFFLIHIINSIFMCLTSSDFQNS